jgi:hypothetical protein
MSDDEKLPSLRYLIFGCVVIVVICVAYAIFLISFWFQKSDQHPLFGDMFGILNTAFTGLAFAGLIYAVYLQRREISQNNEELRAHRREIEGQDQYYSQQLFTDQFFQLVKAWQEIVHHTDFNQAHGRQAFHLMNLELKDLLKIGGDTNRVAHTREEINEEYQRFYDLYAVVPMGNVFRLLYHIVKFVDENSELTDQEKHKFVRLVRAHLADSELSLLFFNGLSVHGVKFFDLIEKYDLLQNFSFKGIHLLEQKLYPRTFALRYPAGK